MSHEHRRGGVPILLWPFVALWRLLTWIVTATGRLVAVLIGLVVVILGGVLAATVVLAPLGIPLIIIGLLLVGRGLF